MPSGGVYKGTLKGSTDDATLLTMFDGTAFLFYGASGSANLAGVAIAANGTQTSDGRFASNTALDYRVGTAPAAPVVFMTNFAQAPAVSGPVVNKDGSPNLAVFVIVEAPVAIGARLAWRARNVLYKRSTKTGQAMRGFPPEPMPPHSALTRPLYDVFMSTRTPHP